MRSRHAMRWAALALALAGCELGNPTIIQAPDGGVRLPEDLGELDVGAMTTDRGEVTSDVATDVGIDDVGEQDSGAGPDVAPPIDLGVEDGGTLDAGVIDSGVIDSGVIDTGVIDTGPIDSGVIDTGVVDTGPRDTGVIDTGPRDTGVIDTGVIDTGVIDSGPRDTGVIDTGPVDTGVDVPVIVDTGTPDAGPTVISTPIEACTMSGTAAISGVGQYLLTGSTSGRTDDHQPTCTDRQTGDVGYLLNLTAFSRVTWSARPTGAVFAPVVTITQGCSEQDAKFTNEEACLDNRGANGSARGATVDLPAGLYYLSVDGDREGGSGTPDTGPFEISLTITASETSPYYSVENLTGVTCSSVPSSNVSIESGDDIVSGIQALGFRFNFFGREFDRLAFYTNGFFSFIVDEPNPWAADTSWRNHSILFTGLPRGVVAPFWDDLRVDNSSGSGVYFWIDGPGSNHVAHVQWRNASFYQDGTTRVTTEARLYEATDVIELLYCNESRNSSYSRGASATVGVESYDQDQGRLIRLNENGATVPGTGYRLTHR